MNTTHAIENTTTVVPVPADVPQRDVSPTFSEFIRFTGPEWLTELRMHVPEMCKQLRIEAPLHRIVDGSSGIATADLLACIAAIRQSMCQGLHPILASTEEAVILSGNELTVVLPPTGLHTLKELYDVDRVTQPFYRNPIYPLPHHQDQIAAWLVTPVGAIYRAIKNLPFDVPARLPARVKLVLNVIRSNVIYMLAIRGAGPEFVTLTLFNLERLFSEPYQLMRTPPSVVVPPTKAAESRGRLGRAGRVVSCDDV